MSVLACDRRDCENVMCDRLSLRYGYICDDCFNELVALHAPSVEEFMDIPRNVLDLSESAKEKFSREFPRV